MKKSSFIFFICLVLVLSFTSCESSKGIFDFKEYSTVEIQEEEDFLSTRITYPKFATIPELSRNIKNIVESNWNDFKVHAEDKWNSNKNLNSSSFYPPYEYFVDCDVSYSGDIVSVYISTYIFDGGAHGNTNISTINYDRMGGKYLNVSEVSGYSYEELSDICRKSLYKNLIEKDKYELQQESVEILGEMIEEGTGPYAGNFQNFVADGNKVIIYFEPAVVAPYSYGVQRVEFVKKRF